ncbi:MAG: undecaprenyl-diphosphate phosphatase [Planctomycetota bacterium]|nr:undecaprenyl-diphosphate phosphatase [Planctomycetota bacterium]
MEWWQALILGIVEGVTEFLPVSSTGHLIVTQKLMGMSADAAHGAYTIAIQGGAIIAVLGLYLARVKQMGRGLLGKDPQGLKLSINVVAGFIPTAVVALLLEKTIKQHLLKSLWPTDFAWFVGGAVILALTWYPRKDERPKLSLDDLTWKSAALIGLIQCMGMWPGTSRSLVVIAGGLLVGLSLSAAIEYSFLLGVLTLLAATAHEVLKYRHEMTSELGLSAMLIGVVAAGVSAAVAVKWMIGYLNKHGMAVFGYYRVALAMVVMGLILSGKINAEVEATPPQNPPPAPSVVAPTVPPLPAPEAAPGPAPAAPAAAPR